jgi:hypothetical protein
MLPRWLGITVVLLLSLQLLLGYVQGALLHRQQAELHSLRTDLQDLTEAIEQNQGALDGDGGDHGVWRPARRQESKRPAKKPPMEMARAVLDGDEEDRIKKELDQSKESAKKAVQDARKAQEQVSIAENVRKVEARQQVDAAQNQWQKWSLVALGVVALALLARAWIRRRA